MQVWTATILCGFLQQVFLSCLLVFQQSPGWQADGWHCFGWQSWQLLSLGILGRLKVEKWENDDPGSSHLENYVPGCSHWGRGGGGGGGLTWWAPVVSQPDKNWCQIWYRILSPNPFLCLCNLSFVAGVFFNHVWLQFVQVWFIFTPFFGLPLLFPSIDLKT